MDRKKDTAWIDSGTQAIGAGLLLMATAFVHGNNLVSIAAIAFVMIAVGSSLEFWSRFTEKSHRAAGPEKSIPAGNS